jgi:hypothetical protein
LAVKYCCAGVVSNRALPGALLPVESGSSFSAKAEDAVKIADKANAIKNSRMDGFLLIQS